MVVAAQRSGEVSERGGPCPGFGARKTLVVNYAVHQGLRRRGGRGGRVPPNPEGGGDNPPQYSSTIFCQVLLLHIQFCLD